MIAYYPRFIRTYPKFFGLDHIDLLIIVVGMLCTRLFSTVPLTGLILAIIGIVLNKTLLKGVDFTGLLLGIYKRKCLPWIGEMGRER